MALRFSPARGAASLVLNSLVRGPQGNAASISIGTVTTLAPGATPTVSNTGTSEDAVLAFGLPATPTITPGTSTALNAGSSPTVVNGGSSTAQVYNFGIPRGADAGMRYSFDTSTTMGAPSSGGLRFNNATLSSVTGIAINASNSDGIDVSDWVATWDDSTNSAKGYVEARKEGSGAVVGLFSLTSVTDNGTWLQLAVTYLSGSGSLSAADPVYLTPYRIGDKGTNGATAISGSPTVNQFAAWVDNTTIKGVSITGLVKGNGASAPAAAVAGTDYLAPPSGSALLKANSGGALANATAGTDYLAPPSGTALLKANSGGALANATAGTDYMHPGTTSTITKGFTVTPNLIGTVTSGTTTLDPTLGNYQALIDGGAFSLSPPATGTFHAIDLLVIAGPSAGSITFTAGKWRVGSSTGSAFSTTARASATATMTIASPGVVSWTSHGCVDGDPVWFTTTGALPTGVSASTVYYVKYVDANSFQLAATPGGTAINTTGSQSGTHTANAAAQYVLSVRAIYGSSTYSWYALQ